MEPSQAAAFHRLMALSSFAEGEDELAFREFHAARRLDPGYTLPEEFGAQDHPMRMLYQQSHDADEGTLEPVLVSPDLTAYVDGIRNAPRPSGVSTILQAVDDEGAHGESLLGPGAPAGLGAGESWGAQEQARPAVRSLGGLPTSSLLYSSACNCTRTSGPIAQRGLGHEPRGAGSTQGAGEHTIL